jgi:hypothetical protein
MLIDKRVAVASFLMNHQIPMSSALDLQLATEDIALPFPRVLHATDLGPPAAPGPFIS